MTPVTVSTSFDDGTRARRSGNGSRGGTPGPSAIATHGRQRRRCGRVSDSNLLSWEHCETTAASELVRHVGGVLAARCSCACGRCSRALARPAAVDADVARCDADAVGTRQRALLLARRRELSESQCVAFGERSPCVHCGELIWRTDAGKCSANGELLRPTDCPPRWSHQPVSESEWRPVSES